MMRRRSAKAKGPGVLYEHQRFFGNFELFFGNKFDTQPQKQIDGDCRGETCDSNALLRSSMRIKLQKLAGLEVSPGFECPFKYAKYDIRPIFEQLPFDESDSPGRSEAGFGTPIGRR